MGSYLNPGNEKFAQCINSEIYVDKKIVEEISKNINSNYTKRQYIQRSENKKEIFNIWHSFNHYYKLY